MRSPTITAKGNITTKKLSIHRLLAEPDLNDISVTMALLTLSIHRLLAEPDIANTRASGVVALSIHRLLAEPDSIA